MNIIEWHKAFKVQLDTLDNQGAIRLQPEVVDVFFNKAINKIMMDLYDEYEETQGLSDALSSQIKYTSLGFSPSSVIPNQSIVPNLFVIDLPDDYYHHLQSWAIITIDSIDKRVRTVKQLLDSESKVLSNPFKKPDDTEIPIFFKGADSPKINNLGSGGIHIYVPDKSVLKEFNITYLKNPKQVSYKAYVAANVNNTTGTPIETGNSDIDEYLHERIINLAVIYALETYGSERTAAKVQIKDVN